MRNQINKINSNKGFTTADIAVTIVIIILFIGMITTIFYNYYLSVSAKNRNAIATSCVIGIIEEIKTMNYEEIDQITIEQTIEKMIQDGTIPSGYNPTAEITKYNETEANTDKKDKIKILKVTIEYSLSNKTEKIEISTLIKNKGV